MTAHHDATGSTPVAFLFGCRRCGRPAVRYLGGKRRSFYCDEHGPSKVTDWTRLIPIPREEYEGAGRALSVAPPLPARFAKLLDAFADGLRELLADLPAAQVPDMEAVMALEHEVGQLRAQVADLTRERQEYADLANEVLELIPGGPPSRSGAGGLSQPPGGEIGPPGASQGPILAPSQGPTERDFPPPPEGPTPHAPSDAPSLPGPIMPEQEPAPQKAVPAKKPSRGYVVQPKAPEPPPAAEVPEAEEVARTDDPLPTRLPEGCVAFTTTDVEMFSLWTLAARLPDTVPGTGKVYAVGIAARAVSDYKRLSAQNKIAFLYALQFLNLAPQNLREFTLHGEHEGLSAMRLNRQWRMIVSRPAGHTIKVERIVNRGDKRYFKNER
jgi:hypothetical protein